MKFLPKLWRRCADLIPISGFHCDRPLLLLQSDDWGRVGLRDHDGLEQLRSAGLELGQSPYDFYTLETADDLQRLAATLNRHRDSVGRHPCLGMNFILANPDFARMRMGDWRQVHLLPLADGLPEGWSRPGLMEAYHDGIGAGVFHPALHGTSHFCRLTVERVAASNDERCNLLRDLWRAGTPYIYWRMPWIGYEYWSPEGPDDERFLPAALQRELIGGAVGIFAKLFSSLPRSACAPGYRANDDTHRTWAQHGIHVAQSGPGAPLPPHFDRNAVLHLSRTVEFEPATDASFSLQTSLQQAEACFASGIPAVVSMHSINFHSTVRDFCSSTLQFLDDFLSALENRHSDLLYLRDEDLFQLVRQGSYSTDQGNVRVRVSAQKFTKARAALKRSA